jgi:hypothetical protein
LKTHLDLPEQEVEQHWPNLDLNNHHETSKRCSRYNCIAWAMGINDDRWAPYTSHKWFEGFKKIRNYPGDDIEIHKDGFKSIGFEECQNGNFEKSFEKIAFYIKGKSVEHIARQIENGHWTSKLGVRYHDIEHYTLNALEGGLYGHARVFMKRKIVV